MFLGGGGGTRERPGLGGETTGGGGVNDREGECRGAGRGETSFTFIIPSTVRVTYTSTARLVSVPKIEYFLLQQKPKNKTENKILL